MPSVQLGTRGEENDLRAGLDSICWRRSSLGWSSSLRRRMSGTREGTPGNKHRRNKDGAKTGRERRKKGEERNFQILTAQIRNPRDDK